MKTTRVEQVNGYHVPSTGGQNLYRADLRDAKLRFFNFRFADLRHANLRGTDFTGCDLFNADLRGAHLAGACFFLAKVALPAGYALDQQGCAYRLNNYRTDKRGNLFYEDRDARARELGSLYND